MQAIILDRDGVINEDSDDYIKSPEEWVPIESSLKAIAILNERKIPVFVATNQSGVGRGLYSLETLGKIHEKMIAELASHDAHLDGIYFCPHKPDDNCSCRKPKPGLLLQIADDHKIDLKKAVFVGDSLRDLQAAKAVGAKPILVKTGKGIQVDETIDGFGTVEVHSNLFEYLSSI